MCVCMCHVSYVPLYICITNDIGGYYAICKVSDSY